MQALIENGILRVTDLIIQSGRDISILSYFNAYRLIRTISADGMQALIQNSPLRATDLIIQHEDRISILSPSCARFLIDALSVDGMQALIENGTLRVTDLIIQHEDRISILSAPYARQIVANPERLEDIHKTVVANRIYANPICMSLFEEKKEDDHTSDGDDHTSGPIGPLLSK